MSSVSGTPVPEWLNADLFVCVAKKHIEKFAKIQNFTAKTDFEAGENYLSVLWSIQFEAILSDGTAKPLRYMLKVQPSSASAMAIINMMSCFKREMISYYDLLPAFEEMFKKCGKEIEIAPKAFVIEQNVGLDVILMDDLRQYGFKNMNRLDGLDMHHTKAALEKLAQFHAASATYLAEKGNLPEIFEKPLLTDNLLDLLMKSQKAQDQKLLDNLKLYEAEGLKEIMLQYQPIYFEQLRKYEIRKPEGFYVFSHGDCWSNNIMFRHDADGNILDTRFVDFQVGRLTSPALDLQYFLLSSTNLDIKIKQFDLFVQYYHNKLRENLKLLRYPKRIPSLKDVHLWLFEYSFLAYTVILKSLPVVLLDPTTTNDISIDSMMGEKSEGSDMQQAMYTGKRYIQNMKEILPWMLNRGYFSK